jgi:hypothetical protein
MGFTYIYNITGSADTRAVIASNATIANLADKPIKKIFELTAGPLGSETSVVNIKGNGAISSSAGIRATGPIVATGNIKTDGTLTVVGSINATGTITSTNGLTLPSGTATSGLTYYDGSKIVGSSQLLYKPGGAGFSVLYFTGSSYLNAIQIEGGYTNQSNAPGDSSYREGSIAVAVDNNKIKRGFPANAVGPEYLVMKVITSGSGYFTMDPRSFNFKNPNRNQKSISGSNQNTFHNILQIQDNSFYFWPTPYSYSSIARGAGLGIGVIPPSNVSGSSTLKAALHVNVFSASVSAIGAGGWTWPATDVKNRPAAILVTYGSGSNNSPFIPNFFVSSSGNTYSRGWVSSSRSYFSFDLTAGPGNGALYTKNGLITNINPSDERLKTNIQPITYGLNEVSNLNPVTFYWTEEASKYDRNKKYGFIAQQVAPYVPDLVGTDRDGYYYVDAFSLIPVLVKAIKELKAEVDDLKSKLP